MHPKYQQPIFSLRKTAFGVVSIVIAMFLSSASPTTHAQEAPIEETSVNAVANNPVTKDEQEAVTEIVNEFEASVEDVDEQEALTPELSQVETS